MFTTNTTTNRSAQAGREQLGIGLPLHHVITGIARVRAALLRVADADLKGRAAPTREALNRILDIELAIILEAYRVAEARASQAEKTSDIGNFAVGLAHEIRNPLNAAQLHLVILERAIRARASEQDTLEVGSGRWRGDQKGRVLLTDLLESARRRSGRSDDRPRPMTAVFTPTTTGSARFR